MYYLVSGFVIVVFSIYSYLSNKRKRDKAFYESLKPKRKNNNKFDYDKVKDLYLSSKDDMNSRPRIDDITWNDLEMDKLFNSMDNTITSIGAEYLYRELHYIDADENVLDKRLALYELFNVKEYREKIGYILNSVGKVDYNGLSVFMRSNHKLLPFSQVFTVLRYAPYLSVVAFFYDKTLAAILFITSMAFNFLVHYMIKHKIRADITAINYLSNIILASKELLTLSIDNKAIQEYQEELSELTKSYSRVRVKFLNTDIDYTSIVGLLIEYYKAITLSDAFYYNKIVSNVIHKRDLTNKIIDRFAELDMCFALSAYKNCFDIVTTYHFTDKKVIDFVDVYHPLVEKPVTNTYNGFTSSIITGSNATGKSTFIKALAISAIFSQSLGFAFANHFAFRKSLVITSMAIRDDISSKESYFIREIKSLKRIVDRVESTNAIVFIDEILRGTNTIERISASEAVLRYLNTFDSIVVAATHDIELTYLLKDIYHNMHFNEDYDGEDIQFDFILKTGPSESNNAIKLLEIMGFDDEVIANARLNASEYIDN